MSEQTISRFFDVATRRDFARDFLFQVETISFGDGDEVNMNPQDLVYAISASVPSRAIENISVPYRGLTFNVPGSVKYGSSADYKIKFYCEANSNLYSRFIRESRRVFQDAQAGDQDNVPGGTTLGTTGDYRIAGQAATMSLKQLDKRLTPVKTFTLIGVSIREVGAMEFTMAEGKGDVVKFDVSLAYHYYRDDLPDLFADTDEGLFQSGASDAGGLPVLDITT